ncbi:IST1-like protein [Lolium rigidum]|uniref:IST1-like protein n=1 Tax=Lolium rigidum TaxID=89674 RepID=UPI001F5E262D|nr:IST1-like protein [Lolium rigidum]
MMMPTAGESSSPVRALRRMAGALLAAARLRGSFSASKCKTEARMAAARMKLLRNRRDAQLRKMRGDVAALLRDGRDDTARIRVEHVIREQNTMAANEIIELFCELIVTRLPIIAKQKECPADLKEGICSLIFAAPRCSELPELSRMRDLFEKKYGKDFVAAAVDLRPNAGVNNLLIEKLSVNKPSGQTKLKVLKDIAKEHQIDWDTTETEQDLLKPPEELIQGPSSFVEASKMPVKTTLSANFAQPYPSNYRSEYADEYDNGGAMQFKDAASAARAAAESAAQAASAAKAAADLVNKNTHSSDESTHSSDDDEDWKTTRNESTHSSRRQTMSNTSRSSRKENLSTFDELRPRGSTGKRFSGSYHTEDKNTDLMDLDTGRMRKRNSTGRAARKVHSEIKFDDSEAEDESDAEIQSLERPPPRRERYQGNGHSDEKELDDDFPEPPKANLASRVHPSMPLDFETLTARFEALRSGKLP